MPKPEIVEECRHQSRLVAQVEKNNAEIFDLLDAALADLMVELDEATEEIKTPSKDE